MKPFGAVWRVAGQGWMSVHAVSSLPGRRATLRTSVFLAGFLMAVLALAPGSVAWAGGGRAPSPSGTRPGDLGAAPPLTLPPGSSKQDGAAGSARAPVPWNPDPATTSGALGTGAPGEAFRFRGDKTLQQAPGVEAPSAPGYRFRPLTPAEQERAEELVGWRPLGREGHRAQVPAQETPQQDDAYGYQSDSWFRKYYGDRP
jgi:hypothetical protein